MNIKVINAGNCVMCGREIKVTNNDNHKLPNIFFCPRCEEIRVREDKKARNKNVKV